MDKIIAPISSQFTGFYNKVIGWTENRWVHFHIKELGGRIRRWHNKKLKYDYTRIKLLEDTELEELPFSKLPSPAVTAEILDREKRIPGAIDYQKKDGSEGIAIIGNFTITTGGTQAVGNPTPCWGGPGMPAGWEVCRCRGSLDACLTCCHLENGRHAGVIATTAALCHIVAGMCWFCHIPCFVNDIYWIAILAIEFDQCTRACRVQIGT